MASITFPPTPRFYARSTAEGIPYWKIARLHGTDVLATTVLQTCVRYGRRETACQFCAIGQSLARKATVVEKTPSQLAEVAAAAVELDQIRHVVLTTGTPHTEDRGADVLARVTEAIKGAVSIPVQAQCEPPADLQWLDRMAAAGVDSLGMHIEAVTEEVRRRITPGKAEVPLASYFRAFARAVDVFGRGQVSTYILAGLGDAPEDILAVCRELVAMGVYPFVVPFVPIAGTPLEHHPPPSARILEQLLGDLSLLLASARMKSTEIKAGCGRCGACSSLRAREASMVDLLDVWCDPYAPFFSPIVTAQVASEPWQLAAYFKLRRAVFAEEQQLFEGSDVDEHDAGATHIVALEHMAGMAHEVIGAVRIYETEPCTWYGGRLGVSPRYRSRRVVGSTLICAAVSTAHAWGCRRFLATIQVQNVRYFERHRFRTIRPVDVCGAPHHLMEADLAAYPARAAVSGTPWTAMGSRLFSESTGRMNLAPDSLSLVTQQLRARVELGYKRDVRLAAR